MTRAKRNEDEMKPLPKTGTGTRDREIDGQMRSEAVKTMGVVGNWMPCQKILSPGLVIRLVFFQIVSILGLDLDNSTYLLYT